MISGPRVAVVTGSAQGIGRRVAEVLGEDGHRLILADIKEPAETASALATRGMDVLSIVGDVADDTHAASMAAMVQKRYGRVDVLVNNAGIALISPAETTEPSQWRHVLEVNLTGPFLLCRALGSMMLAAGAGSIVNVASIAGLRGVADRAAYNASKHGLVGLTRTLACEWGGRGVRVNAVCPGWVKTDMDLTAQDAGLYGDSDITDQVPMGRFARPDDIAAAVSFLADPGRSGFINGIALAVDGGWTADAGWTSLRLSKR